MYRSSSSLESIVECPLVHFYSFPLSLPLFANFNYKSWPQPLKTIVTRFSLNALILIYCLSFFCECVCVCVCVCVCCNSHHTQSQFVHVMFTTDSPLCQLSLHTHSHFSVISFVGMVNKLASHRTDDTKERIQKRWKLVAKCFN